MAAATGSSPQISPPAGKGLLLVTNTEGRSERELTSAITTLEAEVELLECFAGGKARLLDPALAAVRVSRCDLGCKQRLGEALVAPLFVPGALGQLGQRSGGGRRFQRPEQVAELRGLRHLVM